MSSIHQGSRICATQNQTVPLFVTGRPKPVAYFATQTRTLQKGIDTEKLSAALSAALRILRPGTNAKVKVSKRGDAK